MLVSETGRGNFGELLLLLPLDGMQGEGVGTIPKNEYRYVRQTGS